MLPANFAYWAMIFFGAVYGLRGQQFTIEALTALSIAFTGHALTLWGEWFWNDIFDKETDKYTNTNRTTTTGALTDRDSLILAAVLVGAGLLVSVPLGWYGLASMFAWVVVNTVYSPPPIRLKSNAYTCMLCIGLLSATSFLVGTSVVVDSPSAETLAFAAAIVPVTMVAVSYKDLKDAEHDEKSDAANFVVKFGAETMRKVLMVALPVVYFGGMLYFDLPKLLPLSAVASVVSVYLLHSRTDRTKRLVFELDILNGLYLVALGAAYYV